MGNMNEIPAFQTEPETLLDIERQESIEKYYSKKHADALIRQELLAPGSANLAKVEAGIAALKEWLADESHHESKKARIEPIKAMDMGQLVMSLYTGFAYITKPHLFTSVTGMLASRLGFDDKRAAIQTIAEVCAVLCHTDACEIFKLERQSSLMLVGTLDITERTRDAIARSQYLPPMVCKPNVLKGNYDSGYLTLRGESLVLGRGNHHDGELCIDVLNRMNQVPLKLDTEFLKAVEEEPAREYTIEGIIEKRAKKGEAISEGQAKAIQAEMLADFKDFKRQSIDVYLLMHKMDNKFYLTHKVDKRGRIYTQGYHINTQGAAFKKACVELFHEEVVTGI